MNLSNGMEAKCLKLIILSQISSHEITEVSYRDTFLTKYIPDHEDHTDSDHETDDDGVASLSKIYFVDEIIYHRELAGEVVQLGLDCLGK